MSRKFSLSVFLIATGFFVSLAYAQTQYHLPNPLYLTLRNVTTNREYTGISTTTPQALEASSNDTLLFKWAKVNGAQAYWYSSDLIRDSQGRYCWERLDRTQQTQDDCGRELAISQAHERGTYF